MKTRPSLVGLPLMSLAVSTPSRADLFIQELWVSADADGDYIDDDYTPNDPFDPLLVMSTVTTRSKLVRSLQTKNGYFRDFARVSEGFGGSSSHSTDARSTFRLVVGATTPNSPLVLDFNFLGAHVSGSTYYGAGQATALVQQTIKGNHGNGTNIAWAFEASIELQNGSSGWWANYYSWTDPNQIGMPAVHLTPHYYDTGFTTGLEMNLAAFLGHLDFGVLQPGEFFTLEYEAIAEVYGTLTSGGILEAEVIDPFTLGGPPPPQLSLQGLTLPLTPVIEPRLKIALVDNEHARITWPTNAAGYALQFTTSLPALAWNTITNPPTVIGDRFALIVDTTDGSRFYRLR